jgi:hypothetical protein
MSPKLKEILQQVESWPEEDQEELADVARDIVARRVEILSIVRRGTCGGARGDGGSAAW